MPKEAVAEFLRSVANDKAIMEQLVGHAAERGYEFTISDLKNHFAAMLGDEDLESVMGGTAKKKPVKKKTTDLDSLPPTMLNT
jgi:hypothetical protein